MAFFNLTEIKINNTSDGDTLGLTKQILRDSRYMSNVLRYPLDIGSLDKGHYMVIHINQQEKTRFDRTKDEVGLPNFYGNPTIIQNQKYNGTPNPFSQTVSGLTQIVEDVNESGPTQISKEMIKKGASFLSDKANAKIENMNETFQEGFESAAGGLNSFGKGLSDSAKEIFNLANSGKGLRTIKRTTDSIAFYMPDTLNFTNNQQYSTIEFGSSPLAYLAAATAGYSQIKGSGEKKIESAVKNLTPFILNNILRKTLGGAGSGVFAAGFGAVVNPQLEMIYSSPSFREFRFDFMLYPRSSKEAVEVQKILQRLRFHQAPEVLKEGIGALGGFFLVPPSEFDIKFYYNGSINPNIPQISTCVLTSIDTDYAPNGWSAYESPDNFGQPEIGKTGMPVGIRLSLNFQETEILTKDSFVEVAGRDRDDVAMWEVSTTKRRF